MPSHNVTPQSGNRLLAALPVQDYQRIHPALETVPLRIKETILEAGGPIPFVHFPTAGIISLSCIPDFLSRSISLRGQSLYHADTDRPSVKIWI